MQGGTSFTPVNQDGLPYTTQILSKKQFLPTPWMGYGLQQKSCVQPSLKLINPQAYSRPISISANLQSNQTLQMSNYESQSQLPYVFSDCTGHRSSFVHCGSSKTGQVKTFNVNCDAQVLNISNQRDYKTQHSMQNDTYNNTNGIIENSHCMSHAIQPWQQQLNRQHHEVQAQYKVTPRYNCPVESHIPVYSSNIISSTPIDQSQLQNGSHPPSPCRQYSSQPPGLQNMARTKYAIHNKTKQNPHQFSHNLPKNRNLSQTTTNSPHHSKTNLVFSAIQNGTQQQFVQSDATMSGLTSGSGSKKKSQISLLRQLLQGNTGQFSDLNFFCNTFRSNYAGFQKSAHGTYSRAMASQGNEYQGPSKERLNQIAAYNQKTGAQKLSHNEFTNWKRKNGKMESYITLATFQTVPKSQPGMVQQVNKAVAVVPLISQQTFSHKQNDISTDTQLSPPVKTSTVNNLSKECENLEKEENVQNVTSKLIEGVPHMLPLSHSSTILRSLPNTLVLQSCEISSSENKPVSLNQIRNRCQDAVYDVDSTLKGSVEQRDVQEVLSEDSSFDLSTVPVVNYTLKELMDLVKKLELKSAEENILTETNVLKCIKDLYYNSKKQNVANIDLLEELLKTSSELCIKEMQGVVLQYLLPEQLKILKNCFQVPINTTIPSEDFKSSWLNVDGQPADVENVLAEPIADYNLTWCMEVLQSVSESVVDVVDSLTRIDTDISEAHKDISPQKTTTEKIPEICHPDPGHSLETDMVKNNEQSFNVSSLTSSSDKQVTNNNDVFENADTSDDSESLSFLPEIIPLSSKEVKIIFSDCSESDKKRDLHHLHQREKKELVTCCVKTKTESVKVRPQNDFKFTCAHVNDIDCGSGLFCFSCWNETPILSLEQDETPLLLGKKEPKMHLLRQSHSPDSGKPIEYLKAHEHSDQSDVMKDLGDQMQESRALTAKEPHDRITNTKNGIIAKRVVEDCCKRQKTMTSAKAKTKTLKKLDSSSRIKILTGMVSASDTCINVKSTKTDVLLNENDVQFSPDFVIEDSSTHKQHLSNHRSVSGNDRQCSDPSQLCKTLNISGTPKCKATLHKNKKRPKTREKGQIRPCKKTKKARLELYGSKNQNSSPREKKVSLTPVYLTVCFSSNTAKTYTDEP